MYVFNWTNKFGNNKNCKEKRETILYYTIFVFG